MEGVGNEYTDLRSPEYQAVIVVDYDDGRMFPLTESIPKCLLPIANRKLLAYQLDMLSKSNVIETFIVTPEEFEAPLKQFIAETHREGMNVEIISLPEMNGTTHALHAVSDRIRGDFFFINSDVLSQVSLMDLANLHRLSISDVTILFTIPNKDMLKDDVDQEYIGLTSEGRIIYKISTLELEGEITLPKTLFQKLQSKPFSMRNDLLDIGIYLFSHWTIDFIKDCYKRMSSIKNDLLPYLIQRQFQNQLYLENKISALKHRKRPLSFLETWLTTKEKNHYSSSLSSYQEPFTDPHHSVPNTPPPPGSLSTSSVKTVGSFQFEGDDNQDHLRVFGLVYSPYGTDSGSTAAAATTPPTLLISRVNTIQTYLTLNKEMPLITHTSRTTWPRLRNFSKKEMSLIGEHVDLGEQIAYRQCFIGNNCKIGKRTKLNNCVIMDGVVIGDNCIIQNSVICEKVVIENNCNLNECNIGMGYKLTAGNEIRGESLAVGSN